MKFGQPVLLLAIIILACLLLGGASGAGAIVDSDADGIPDPTDACPTLAEDADGIDDLDGCPDTDVFADAQKDEAYGALVGVSQTRTVQISVDNGNYPADIIVHALAVSTLGACEVSFVPEVGDGSFTIVTDESGDTTPDTLSYLLEWQISLNAGQSYNTSRDYEVTCQQAGQHSFEIQVDAVPWPPVEEEDVEDLPNVHKNFPAVSVTSGPALDSDGDGFSDAIEAFVGTSETAACPSTTAAGDEEPDAWPPDFDDNQAVTILDIVQLTPPVFNSSPPDADYVERDDLNADDAINILDIVQMTPPVFNTSCG
jgi:hypothetical protein